MAEPFHCEQCGWVSALPGRTECPYCSGNQCRDCQQPRPCPCDETRERLAKEQAWEAGSEWCETHWQRYPPEGFCPQCDPRGDEEEPSEKPWSEAAETTAAWETEAAICQGCGQVETSATECHVCGGNIDRESAECVECGWTSRLALQEIEARELIEEERRRGVIDTEEQPPWQRKVLVLLDECYPVVYEALQRSRSRFVNTRLTDILCLLRDAQLDVEDEK